jgi:hypothetical protein
VRHRVWRALWEFIQETEKILWVDGFCTELSHPMLLRSATVYLISSGLIVPLNESPLVRKFPRKHHCRGRQGI